MQANICTHKVKINLKRKEEEKGAHHDSLGTCTQVSDAEFCSKGRQNTGATQDLQQKPWNSWQKAQQEDMGMASKPGGNGSTFFTPRDKLLVYLTLPSERPGQTDV